MIISKTNYNKCYLINAALNLTQQNACAILDI